MIKLIQKNLPMRKITAVVSYLAHSESKLVKLPLLWAFNLIYKPNLEEARETDLNSYSNLNDFFIRKIKEERRPINRDPNLIVCPVDGVISNYGLINDGKLIQAKGMNYSIESLLVSTDESKKFKGGYFVTIYLAPKDYHRIHAPMDGKIYKSVHVPGDLYSVNQTSQESIPNLYSVNERTILGIKHQKVNYAVVSVGAAIVGSIVPFWYNHKLNSFKEIIQSWKDGPKNGDSMVRKGQELAFFQMGSTVVLIFEKKLNLNSDFLEELKPVKLGDTLFKIR